MLGYKVDLTSAALGDAVIKDAEWKISNEIVQGSASTQGTLHSGSIRPAGPTKRREVLSRAKNRSLRFRHTEEMRFSENIAKRAKKGVPPLAQNKIAIGNDERELGYSPGSDHDAMLAEGNGQYVTTGQLLTYWSEDDWISKKPTYGTATLINRRHILSAAHNITRPFEGMAYRCVFTAALNGSSPLLVDRADVISVYTSFHPNDIFYGDIPAEDDYCLLILNKNIGDKVGWRGFAPVLPYAQEKLNLQLEGYPYTKAHKKYDGTNFFVAREKTQGLSSQNRLVRHSIDSSHGQSGAALIWHGKDNPKDGIVVGIHTGGVENSYNEGVVITESIRDGIRRILSETEGV